MYLLTDPEAGGLNRGDVWTLATAVAFGAQIAAVAELSQRYDPLRLVWMETVVTAAGAAVAALLFERVRLSSTPQFLAALAYAGVLATAVALVLQTRAQRHMSATRAALIFCLEPVFATAISWFWLGERLAASQWIGGTLIVAGMLVAEVRKSSGPAS
jgi:drug/metabolite transporter (DMT)-like permease